MSSVIHFVLLMTPFFIALYIHASYLKGCRIKLTGPDGWPELTIRFGFSTGRRRGVMVRLHFVLLL